MIRNKFYRVAVIVGALLLAPFALAQNISVSPIVVAVSQITGLGANVATWLATPSSANLASALTDETGSGVAVFGTSPNFTTGISLNSGTALTTYTESTWTPGLSFNNGTTGIIYSTQAGTFTRIGRMIYANARITLTAKGSSTGTARVTGLPTASGSAQWSAYVGEFDNALGLTGSVRGLVDASATTIVLEQSNATGTAPITDAVFTNTSTLFISVAYSL